MKPTKGPYSFGGSLPIVIDGVERAPAQLFRDNDGSVAIMAPDQTEGAAPDERGRIAAVNLVDFRPKRGEAWKASFDNDPQHAANARLFREAWALYELAVDLANGKDATVQERARAIVKLIDGED